MLVERAQNKTISDLLKEIYSDDKELVELLSKTIDHDELFARAISNKNCGTSSPFKTR